MNEDSFFSIDRLVEFGIGSAIAQQMVRVMNQSMRQAYIPGSIQSMPQPAALPIYVAINHQQVGPLTESELLSLVMQKKVDKSTLVWQPGMLGWKPLEEVPQILKVIALAPPPLPTI